MKKTLLFTAIAVLGLIVIAQKTDAATYLDPTDPTQSYQAGDCAMVSTRVEATGGKVYTLNPDHTKLLNTAYHEYWDRNARCDELQFHVDHGTTLARLRTWLGEVAVGWYKNVGATHFKNQTISTSRHEWFYIDEDGAHRIPDWLTALSWGLLIEDRLSIWPVNTNNFYNNVTIAEPLYFSDGHYADKISGIWKNNDRDFSLLPSRLAEEIETVVRQSNAFTACTFSWYSAFPGNPWDNLLDWSWMLHNSGCPLAD